MKLVLITFFILFTTITAQARCLMESPFPFPLLERLLVEKGSVWVYAEDGKLAMHFSEVPGEEFPNYEVLNMSTGETLESGILIESNYCRRNY